MTTITILVPDPAGALIEARVASGEYASASDDVSDLILRDRSRDEGETRPEQASLSDEDRRWLGEFDHSIAQGIADAEAGRVRDADQVFDEIEAHLRAMTATEEA